MKSKRFWVVAVLFLALGVLLAYEHGNWRRSRLAASQAERDKREPLIVEFELAVASADTVTESIRGRYERSISEDEKAIEERVKSLPPNELADKLRGYILGGNDWRK